MNERSEGAWWEESQVQAEPLYAGQVVTEDSWKTDATAEASPSTEVRELRAHPGRWQAQVWLRKAIERPGRPVGELAKAPKRGWKESQPSRGSTLWFQELCPF